MIEWYRNKVAQKLDDCCKEVLSLVENLQKEAEKISNVSAQIFLLKMKADYCRYMCEFNTDKDK